ncbi:MAG: YARHG domain-containing protein, partial [Eggerthellaceae bacterium]|nr:YARHG domain-containing protein [Eggerthellaceae bacterium]
QTTFTRDVFNDRSWYKPTITDYDKVNSSLSSTERANTDLILALEKERSSPFTDDTYVKSLNYSSFDTEYILPSSSQIEYSSSTLEKYSSFELFIARNEFYAKKGYDFETSYLDEYFSRRSWYSKKTKNYDQVDGSMSQVERTNINRILEIERKRNSPYLKDQYVASL